MCFGEGSEGSRDEQSWQEGALAARDTRIEEWRNAREKSSTYQIVKKQSMQTKPEILQSKLIISSRATGQSACNACFLAT